MSSPTSSQRTSVQSARANQVGPTHPPGWLVVALVGASAGVAVIAFLVLPWAKGISVIPALAAWVLVVSARSRPGGWKHAVPILLLAGVTAIALGALLVVLLSAYGP
jgi:hypothetical protein